MKFYFDVTETFIRTIAIEADDFDQAEKRIAAAYNRKEFEMDRTAPDDVEFVNAQKEVEESIEQGFFSPDELETFDCNGVVYDKDQDAYVCPMCSEYAVNRHDYKDIDYTAPAYCSKCGTKFKY